ncbi:hypothetical protein K490DRAFT_39388 [Saccharata proteae CBS 121410]|uniref:M protein, serotype 2.1 n=1 Tax=Saccharata proteae CBS 121410 TaxID=1314787 RepID=A0A9P4LWM2_9PEZI|nr:hypothetical protein K490DRAFT_39388 [Saccharata proteae CBS 121410]
MSTAVVKKPQPPGSQAGRVSAANSPSGVSSRSPSGSRSSTPTATPSINTSTAANGVGRRQSVKSTPITTNVNATNQQAEEDAKAETAALISDLKERLQKAESVSEEYQKSAEVLKTRLDDALKDQAKLEERVHEEEEKVEGLENDRREAVRQKRELEGIYEAERAAFMKEKEQAQAREDELHEVIQRLKDQLAERERGGLETGHDRRMSRSMSFQNTRSNSTTNIENGHFAPPQSLQRSNSQNSSKLLLQKDKVIESLRLELAEAQIKAIEMENMGGGRMQEMERILLETRMTNARLMEDNESFQLLLSEKTLNGDFSRGDFMRSTHGAGSRESMTSLPSTIGGGDRPSTSLADELGAAADEDAEHRRLETEITNLKDQNKALTLYINKIIERLLQHQGFEAVLGNETTDPPKPPKPAPSANKDKDLPPPPPKQEPAPSFLQRAKSVVGGPAKPRSRPQSQMPPPSSTTLTTDLGGYTNPATAPSIPIAARQSSGSHRRANSEWSNSAASLVNNMYRHGPSAGAGNISPGIVSPRNSFFGAQAGSRMSSGASSIPRQSIDENQATGAAGPTGTQLETISNSDSGTAVDTPSPPRSVASSGDHKSGPAVINGNKIRPLRLVQESEEAEKAQKAANRQSWIGSWFSGKGGSGAGEVMHGQQQGQYNGQ